MPQTTAGRALLIDVDGHDAVCADPSSCDFTTHVTEEQVLAIEAEARQPYEDALRELVAAVRSGNGWEWTELEEQALHTARTLLANVAGEAE